MSRNWWIQQSISSAQFKGRAILCNEGDAKKIHQLKSERKHHIELKEYLHHAQSSLYC